MTPASKDASVQDLTERVEALFRESGPEATFTFPHILSQLDYPSPEALVLALQQLVEARRIQRIVRVQSLPTGGGIEDFSSLLEVPDEMHDWREDVDFRVQPEHLVVLFKRPPA